jgi:hypothetical protein
MEAGDEGPAVYVVEGPGVGPVFFCVIDFKAAIWRNARSISGEVVGRGLYELQEGLDGT